MTQRDPDTREVERQLSRHQLPAPQDSLRRQILAAAGRVVETSAPPALSERIWLSRSWRLGWAAALALLLLGQFVMARSAERAARRLLGPASGSRLQVEGSARSMAEMAARELGLEPRGSIALAGRTQGPGLYSSLSELPPEE